MESYSTRLERVAFLSSGIMDFNDYFPDSYDFFDPRANIEVMNFPFHMDERDLYNMFAFFGPVRRVSLVRSPCFSPVRTTIEVCGFGRELEEYRDRSEQAGTTEMGNSLGYGYVEFHDRINAYKAIRHVNGTWMFEKRLLVFYAPEGRFGKLCVYVSNLPTAFSEHELKRLFRPFGNVTNATFRADEESGFHHGVGVVKFTRRREVESAKSSLDGQILVGSSRPLLVHSPDVARISIATGLTSHRNRPGDDLAHYLSSWSRNSIHTRRFARGPGNQHSPSW